MTLIPYSEALGAIAAVFAPASERLMLIGQALGAVPARAAVGVVASPAFNNSAMDGFAVCAADTVGATRESPVELPIAGELKVGARAEEVSPGTGCSMRTATGALTPTPLDAVIPLEQSTVIRRQGIEILRLTQPVVQGRNLRIKGEEYPAGAVFNFTGQRLKAGHIALLSAAGISGLSCRTSPPLALITTGDEVCPPGSRLAAGQIANANAFWLAAWCAERRLPVTVSCHLADDAKELAGEFRRARERGARMLVSSGSASAGSSDVLRPALESLKAKIVFHGVAIRPGKPVLLALLDDGTPVFGLPGNPLATAAGMRFLVWPGIRAVMGMDAEQPERVQLSEKCDLTEGYTHLVLARRASKAGMVKLVNPQRPGQAGALAGADCWLRLEGGHTPAGSLVDRYSL